MLLYQYAIMMKQTKIKAQNNDITNRQLIQDRRLFNKCLQIKNNQFQCSPHMQICLGQVEKLLADFMMQFNDKLLKLQQKIEHIDSQLRRVNAAMKFKNSKKLFSFANSPNSKSAHNFTQSAQKYKKSQQKLSNQYNSTQPKSRHKSINEFSNQKLFPQQNIIQSQMTSLRHEVLELKRQLFRVHGWDKQYNGQSSNLNKKEQSSYIGRFEVPYNNSYNNSTSKYNLIGKITSNSLSQHSIQGIQMVQRYKAIIKQYQKQQQLLRLLASKSEKYKNGLQFVLQWLKDLRQVQLPKYLPCQHCQLKNILFQFLNTNPIQANQFVFQNKHNGSQLSHRSSNALLQVEQYLNDENDSDLIESEKDRNYANYYTS